MSKRYDLIGSVVSGSMQDIADKENMSLAETWAGCEVMVICDGSGSMMSGDSRHGHSRFETLEEEVRRIQEQNPGKIAIVSFSDTVMWNPDGNPYYYGGMTNMVAALEFARKVDGAGVRIILISDGEPDSKSETLRVAKTFQTKIDTIFVGAEDDTRGRNFLSDLAEATGGTHQDDFRVKELGEKITFLLSSGS